jgi:7-carboxy-7-deazaguanine synthase
MGFAVNVETQGTVFKDWMLDVDMLTLSPKGPSSGNVVDYATPEFATMVRQAEEVCLKVVVFDDADLNYAKAVHLRYPETNFYLQVGTYSGGLDGKAGQEDRVSILERWRELIEKVSGDPEWAFARVGVQQHALVWGHGRGF